MGFPLKKTHSIHMVTIALLVTGLALLVPLLDTLHEPAFRQAVADLPGYDISRMGEIVAVSE